MATSNSTYAGLGPLGAFALGEFVLGPTVSLSAIMAVTETNEDMALFAIQVYNAASVTGTSSSANVSITEIISENNAAASVRE